MDNKITKKRLSGLLSYDWILILVFIVIAVFVFELFFAVFGVRIQTGQNFKYYYDINVTSNVETENTLINMFNKNRPFNYKCSEDDKDKLYSDIIELTGEIINAETNVLSTRLSVQEGDVIFTDIATTKENPNKRACELVDTVSFPMYSFDKLLADAKTYLSQFLKDEYNDLSQAEKFALVYDTNNFSVEKIHAHFTARLGNDNRFRGEANQALGREGEKNRIFTLSKEISDFEYLLTVGDSKGVLFRYTKYEQSVQGLTEEEKKTSKMAELYQKEIAEGRQNLVYGLKVENFTGGKNPSELFKLNKDEVSTARDIVVMAFDFLAYQPEMQFETINFINMIVRECSDLYAGR